MDRSLKIVVFVIVIVFGDVGACIFSVCTVCLIGHCPRWVMLVLRSDASDQFDVDPNEEAYKMRRPSTLGKKTLWKYTHGENLGLKAVGYSFHI